MKPRRAPRRRRALARAFTLIELMVVVTLIAVLAALAVPSFSRSRDDRKTFDYARQYQQILVQGRSRSAGRGSAHLALMGPGPGGRGFIRLFAALDGTATPAGPNPTGSCNADPTQWTQALVEPPVPGLPVVASTNDRARLITWADLNRPGINDQMEVTAELRYGTGAATTTTLFPYLVVCITPAGITYVGSGATATAAVAAMRMAAPFRGVAEIDIQRHDGGSPVGLKRRVMLTGGGAPRLRSE